MSHISLSRSVTTATNPWTHYTNDIISLPLRTVSLVEDCVKPCGLYFSLGDTWIDHCNVTGCGNSANDYRYELQNADDLRTFVLNDEHLLIWLADKPTLASRSSWYPWHSFYPDFDAVHVTEQAVQTSKKAYLGFRDRAAGSILSFDVETLVVWNVRNIKLQQK